MDNIKYYWIRIFDYKQDDELKEYSPLDWDAQKGTMLDEYYVRS